MDLTFGSVYGAGGEFRERSGIALGAQFDFLRQPNKPRSFGLAVRFDVLATPGSGDDCLIGPRGNCIPRYPSFLGGALGPLLSLHAADLLRVDLGGGVGDYIEVDDFSQNLGFFGQLRVVGPRDARMGLGIGLTLHVIPSASPDALFVTGFAATIRVGL